MTTTLTAAGGAAAGYYLAERLLPHDREKLDSTAFNALNGRTQALLLLGVKRKGCLGIVHLLRDYVSKRVSRVGSTLRPSTTMAKPARFAKPPAGSTTGIGAPSLPDKKGVARKRDPSLGGNAQKTLGYRPSSGNMAGQYMLHCKYITTVA